MEKSKVRLSKNFWIIMTLISIVCIVLIAVGYNLFSNREKKVVEKEKTGGSVVLNYTSSISGLSIINAVKTTDELAIKDTTDGKYFDFSVEVDLNDASSIEYELAVTKDIKISTISDDDMRIYLEKEKSGTYTQVFAPAKFTGLKENSDLGTKKGSMILYKETKKKAGVDNYRLKMWLADTSLLETGNYSVEVSVVGKAK